MEARRRFRSASRGGCGEEREEADGLGFSRMSGGKKAGEANSTHLGRGRASAGAAMPAEATVNGGLCWHGGRK